MFVFARDAKNGGAKDCDVFVIGSMHHHGDRNDVNLIQTEMMDDLNSTHETALASRVCHGRENGSLGSRGKGGAECCIILL